MPICQFTGKSFEVSPAEMALRKKLAYYSSSAQDQSYDVKFGYNLTQCKFAEYSAHCFQCQNIFGCCGLVGKKYYIFN
jgi:hypothetical protein